MKRRIILTRYTADLVLTFPQSLLRPPGSMDAMDGAGAPSEQTQGDLSGNQNPIVAQPKFTSPAARGQVGGVAPTSGGGVGSLTEIDHDFNILANYFAEELQYGESVR